MIYVVSVGTVRRPSFCIASRTFFRFWADVSSHKPESLHLYPSRLRHCSFKAAWFFRKRGTLRSPSGESSSGSTSVTEEQGIFAPAACPKLK
jgi:hypothetical protein